MKINWLGVSLFLAGILAGTVGSGGVGAIQYARLESRMEQRYIEDHERLVKIETDVAWIRQMLAKIDGSRYNGGGKSK